ncbi:MAG: DUF4835 family protein [Saprospiraceae bacterium]|nr:DUF4835 family protein [Saprospiraceae bacterium]
MTVSKYFKYLYCFALVLVSTLYASAQELNINVKVDIQANLTVDKSIFSNLGNQISEFINNTKWTEEVFEQHEKISGSLQMNIINELDPTTFEAEIIFQTSRPVYNSNYETTIINFIDKNINFKYTGIEPILKTTNTFYDNLSSIISFYCYMTLAMDFDSFSMFGGDPYLEMAREVITSLPSNYAFDRGWTKDTGNRRNRFYFLENLTNPVFRPFREGFYDYHRMALDKVTEDEGKTRAIMQSALTSMGDVDTAVPNSMIIQMFGNAKKTEIIEIFKKAERGQKSRIAQTMIKMDKSKAGDYKVLEN